jgi:hypothetical protein
MSSRKLTQGEIWLCHHVFRDSLAIHNLEVVKRHGISGGFTPYGRVNMDPTVYEADYIGGDLMRPVAPLHRVHHFLHELVHCWQHFVGLGMMHEFRKSRREGRQFRKAHGLKRSTVAKGTWSDVRFDSIYGYDITDHSDLLEFSMEQQGEIIADYFARLLWGFTNTATPHIGGYPSNAQFQAVLAKFLRDPNYPRDQKRINELRARWRDIPR